MNKQTSKHIRSTLGAFLVLIAGLAALVSAGEVDGIIDHYDAVRHAVYIDGKRYLLAPEAEARLHLATPGVRGYVGKRVDYSATQRSDNNYWIEQLDVIE